jgi:predicted HTH domain antitoxin
MSDKAFTVTLEVSDEISHEARATALSRAEEAIVLSFWESGEISTRRAAEELGLTYRGFLDLLAERGIPVERGPLDLEGVEETIRSVKDGHP